MNILVIGDTHFPGQHDRYLSFILETANRFSIDRFIHIGDLVDFHYISRHPVEPDAVNPIQELGAAKEEVSKWVYHIPDLVICQGNHDMIPYRQAKTLGIPDVFLKGLPELLDTPDTWKWQPRWIYGKTVFEHGIGSNGMYGAKHTANKYRTNYVQGHTHSYAGVWWLDSPFDSIFGMQVGCGIDTTKYHARYGREIFKHDVALGCGVILDADTAAIPLYVPMEIEKGFGI